MVEEKIKIIKKFIYFYFEFDFDKALVDEQHVADMFSYLNTEYESSYYTDYKGIGNYNHAIGIGEHNVLMGKKGIHEEDRKIFNKLKEDYIEKNSSEANRLLFSE